MLSIEAAFGTLPLLRNENKGLHHARYISRWFVKIKMSTPEECNDFMTKHSEKLPQRSKGKNDQPSIFPWIFNYGRNTVLLLQLICVASATDITGARHRDQVRGLGVKHPVLRQEN
ncbi:hypothetical protein ACTXT7_016197 [Hymenolepis weldensis]